jgi:putative hemolysin
MSHKTFLFPVFCILFSVLPACSGVQLVTPAVSCERDGQSYTVGTGGIPAEDNCNTCFCDKDGGLTCTEKACGEGEVSSVDGVGLANPAAVKCEADGYTYEIRTAEDGSQSGVCIDAANKECSDWEYYRNECVLGQGLKNYAAELKDTNQTGADGKATLQVKSDQSTVRLVVHSLPLLGEQDFYEAFILRVEPFEQFSLGKLAWDTVEQKHILIYETPEDLGDFDRVFVVAGSAENSEKNPHLLEGNFETATQN